MKSIRMIAAGVPLVLALGLVLGCGSGEKKGNKDPKAEKVDKGGKGGKGAHVHGSGPHGGTVGDWGGGAYHFEIKPNHDTKEVTVWILGSDETTATPIKAKDGQLKASVTGMKTKDTFEMVLKADPQKGDPEGKASRFTGKHDKVGIEQEFKGIVSGEVDGTPFFGDFEETAEEPKKK